MSRSLADDGGDSRQPSAESPANPGFMNFLNNVYALEVPRMIAGSPATLGDYQTQVRTLQKVFSQECLDRNELAREVRVLDISKSLLAHGLSMIKKNGRESTTCNKWLRTILAIYNFAVEEKELQGKPIKVKKLPELKQKPRAWRPEQISQLLGAAPQMPAAKRGEWDGRHDYALLLFLLNTGTRISAAMWTPSSMLDLKRGEVTVPASVQKHKSDEVFDLLDITVAALKAIEPHRHKTIFAAWEYDDWKNGKWRMLTKRLKRMLVNAGLFSSVKEIPKYKELFHKLRKCFATLIKIKYGNQAATLMCGHSGPTVTTRYIDTTQTGDRPSCRDALVDVLKFPSPVEREPTPPDDQSRETRAS
jgi:integrase